MPPLRWAILLALLVWATPAWASVPIQLDYAAAAPCRDEAVFWAQLVRRSPDLVRAASDRRLTVQLRPDAEAGGFVGVLVLETLAGRSDARIVRGKDCTEVQTALALLAALTIAPQARETELEPMAAQQSAPLRSPARRRPLLIAIALLGAGVQGGAVPAWSPSLILASRFFAPQRVAFSDFGLGLRFSRGPTLSTRAGSAEISVLTLSASLCALHWTRQDWRLGLPCVGLDGGILRGTGSDIARPGSDWATYAAVHAAAHARWRVIGPLFLLAHGALEIPLSRHRFEFNRPKSAIFQVKSVGFQGHTGLALEFN